MNIFQNNKFTSYAKLIILTFLAIVLTMTLMALIRAQIISDDQNDNLKRQLIIERNLSDAQFYFDSLIKHDDKMIRTSDFELSNSLNQMSSEFLKKFTTTLDKIQSQLTTRENRLKSEIREIFNLNEEYIKLIKTAKDLKTHGITDGAISFMDNQVWSHVQIILNRFQSIKKTQLAPINKSNINISGIFKQNSTQLMLAANLFIIIICLLLVKKFTNFIVKPISDVTNILCAIANKDLSKSIIVKNSKNVVGQLMQALKNMNDGLLQTVKKAHFHIINMMDFSKKIELESKHLSYQAEQQASLLHEAILAINNLNSVVCQNYESANQARKLSCDAVESFDQGGKSALQMMQTMNLIADSGQKISKIITIIESIAFQANILALNVSVKVAQAGGGQSYNLPSFATEIRSLSQCSSNAVKEIRELISSSLDCIEQGKIQSEIFRQHTQQSAREVQQVNNLVSEVHASNQLQASSIEQVNKVLSELDQSMQQNVMLLAKSSIATSSICAQANQLLSVINTFKTDAKQIKHAVIFKNNDSRTNLRGSSIFTKVATKVAHKIVATEEESGHDKAIINSGKIPVLAA